MEVYVCRRATRLSLQFTPWERPEEREDIFQILANVFGLTL